VRCRWRRRGGWWPGSWIARPVRASRRATFITSTARVMTSHLYIGSTRLSDAQHTFFGSRVGVVAGGPRLCGCSRDGIVWFDVDSCQLGAGDPCPGRVGAAIDFGLNLASGWAAA
jgi:hypothetical protein